jgi:hypothetical protein
MRATSPLALISALVLPPIQLTAATATYNMVKAYAGSTFFDDWQFYDHCRYLLLTQANNNPSVYSAVDNLTNGDAMYVYFLPRLANTNGPPQH